MSRMITNASLLPAVRRLSVPLFVALTLSLAACGGGGSGNADSRLDSKSPYTDKPSGGDSAGGDSDSNDGADDDGTNQDPSTETPDANAGTDNDAAGSDSDPDTVTDGSGDDAPTPDSGDDSVADGGNVTDPDPVVEEPATGDDSDLVDEVVSEVSGAVRLVWDRPEYRENGEYLEGDDIGGYELRYRRVGEEDTNTVIINDGWDEDYELGELVGSYQFSIAAFDNNGLYSEFVSLSPATGLLGSP